MSENLFWHQRIFIIFLYISWILYVLSLFAYFGLHLKPISLILSNSINLYIGLMLVMKFNFLNKTKQFTEFDKRLAYHAGMVLLLTTIMNWLLGVDYDKFKLSFNSGK